MPTAHLTVNGAPVADGAPAVAAGDRGLTLADGAFETMRAHAGAIFRVERHLARLARALDLLAIPAPETALAGADALHAAAARARRAAPGDIPGGDAAVRLSVTRGPGAGLAPPADPRPTVIVAVQPLPAVAAAVHEAGLSAHVAVGRRSARPAAGGLKTLAYTENVLALLAARRAGADDALVLDTDGRLAGGASSNLFALCDGVLATPPAGGAVLAGVTRAAVLELAAAAGVPTAERPLDPAALRGASEAFLTSALRGVAPLVRVDGRPIGDGRPGAVTRALGAAHAALVRAECATTAARAARAARAGR